MPQPLPAAEQAVVYSTRLRTRSGCVPALSRRKIMVFVAASRCPLAEVVKNLRPCLGPTPRFAAGRRRYSSKFIHIKSRRNVSIVSTSRLGAPSDLLYETNTITFCSVIRGRYGLTGRCTFEHRNRNPSAGRGYHPAGTGRGGTTSGLRAASRGARGPACHRGPSASVLRVSPRLVWLPRMGTPPGLASPRVASGCERGTRSD